jgi:hypothetical protein
MCVAGKGLGDRVHQNPLTIRFKPAQGIAKAACRAITGPAPIKIPAAKAEPALVRS